MNIVKHGAKFFKKNSSLILSLTASAGVIATAALTGKSVLTVDKYLADISENKLKTNETKQKVLQICVPPILVGAGTIACIIGAHCLNKRIQVSLISAYGALDAAFKAYREQMKSENLGEVDEMICNDLAYRKTIQRLEDLLNAPHTEEMCLWIDDYHDEPYWAKESDILKALNSLNKEIFDGWHKGYATLDEFYGLIPGCKIEEQDRSLGWSCDQIANEFDCYMLDLFWDDSFLIDGGTTLCAADALDENYNGVKVTCKYLHFDINPTVDFLD